MNARKQSFIKGAAVLAVAGIISKMLGALYRIPLGQIITSEGMGYYQTAYQLYILLLSLSSSVVPIAISKLVSEKLGMGKAHEAHKIFKVAFVLLAVTGGVLSFLLFSGADMFSRLFHNPDAYLSVLAVAPALFTVSLSASFRGYFQGMQNMIPSAVSQIIEQFTRVAIGFLLVFIFLDQGNRAASAGAIFGTTVGGLASFILLLFIYKHNYPEIRENCRRDKGKPTESTASIIAKIVKFSIPIAIGGSIMPIMGLIDLGIVMGRLQAAGFTTKMANSLYGQLSGMAMSFVNLPQVFTIALAASMVPTISESLARRDFSSVQRKTELGIRISLLIGLPSAAGLYFLAGPIMTMIYPREGATLPVIMSFLAPVVVFLTLAQTTTGILQGMGKERIPVYNMVAGALVKLALSYTLTSMPAINIRGAAISTVAGYAVSALFNLYAIIRIQKIRLNLTQVLIKPILATAAMSATAVYAYGFLALTSGRNSIAALSSIMLAVMIYALVLFLIKGITIEEIEMAPGAGRLSGLFRKKRL